MAKETKTEDPTFEFEARKTIKGFPELHWTGKRPFKSTVYYPAQLKESYGAAAGAGTGRDGWMNKIFWGDNLQVMSHLLKEFRGKVDLIYIDPPFDSKADYKKKIELRGQTVSNDSSAFEEKQYGDIWTNDEYLQFMFERLILLRELLSNKGSIYLHCDWHKYHHLRLILDEIFGVDNFCNEIVWQRTRAAHSDSTYFGRVHDTIAFYRKSEATKHNTQYSAHSDEYILRFSKEENGRKYMLIPLHGMGQGVSRSFFGKVIAPPTGRHWPSQEYIDELIEQGRVELTSNGTPSKKSYLDENKGNVVSDWWNDIIPLNPVAAERTPYPTQKPEALLERIIKASSNPGDLIFDCFMGSGTTQAVAMKLGRRFLGADINLGAVQTTTKRLLKIAESGSESEAESASADSSAAVQAELLDSSQPSSPPPPPLPLYTGFEVYNVNSYDVFRNPLEAKAILLQALNVEPLESSSVYDGEMDGRMVKIMPADVNRIATKADMEELLANLPYKDFERRAAENPREPVLKLTVVCMGHEPDLRAAIEQALDNYEVDIKVVDILTDRRDLQFKREAEGDVGVEGGRLVIRSFYPLNLLQKLSMQRENVDDWRQLVESVMVDFNYDGAVLSPLVIDTPRRGEFVAGAYDIPEGAGKIMVKITDLLSESLEIEVEGR